MYCRKCHYPLEGLASPACPECGVPFDPAKPSTFARNLTAPHRLTLAFGLGTMFLLVFWALVSSGSLAVFFDLPSAILVGGIVIGGVVGTYGAAAPFRTFSAAILARREIDPRRLRLHLLILAQAYRLAWAAGIIGTLVGVVVMVKNMSDPSMIGPGIAFAILALIYGACLAELVFSPLQQLLIARADVDPLTLPTLHEPPLHLMSFGAMIVFVLLAAFFMLAGS